MAKRLIALDIGAWSVKVIVSDLKDGQEVFRDEVRLALPSSPEEKTEVDGAPVETEEPSEPTDPLVDALNELRVVIQPGNDDAWIATMPASQAMMLFLDVPFAERSKVASVLPHLLMDKLPLHPTEVLHDFSVHPHGESHRAMVGFCRKVALAATLKHFELAGLDPTKIVVPEQALGLAASRAIPTTETPFGVLDIGHKHARLVVIVSGRIVLTHTILVAGDRVTSKIAQAFNASYEDAERAKHQYAVISRGIEDNPQVQLMSQTIVDALKPLVRDTRRTLQSLFARDQIEIGALYLTGGSAQIKGIDEWISRELGVPTLQMPRAHDYLSTPLLGLKNGFSDKENLRLLNLRQGAFAFKGRSPYLRKQAFIFGAAAAVFLIMFATSLFLKKESQEARRDAMQAALLKETEALLGEKLSARADIQRRIEGGESGAKSFVPKMSAYELMYRVTSSISPEIELTLTRVEVDVDRKIIQMMGETSDAQAVDRIVSDLEKLGCLQNIKKDKLRVKNDGKADFELQIASECS